MRMLVIACVLLGCAPRKATIYLPTTPEATEEPTAQPTEEPPTQPTSSQPTPDKDSPPAAPLYAIDEALADALSSPLEYIDTGPWFGMIRISVCAYRNERVVVINLYCTPTEMNAFSVVVLSPTRGRVVIYAEADHPISKLKHADYFTFRAETEPPSAKLPPVKLTWTLAQLAAWDEKRYKAHLPTCAGGVEFRKPDGGCLQALEPRTAEWDKRNQPFLAKPSDAWFRIVKDLRARAPREGRPMEKP
jgi:hypothetical protein